MLHRLLLPAGVLDEGSDLQTATVEVEGFRDPVSVCEASAIG
jgi:hypothetical protein